MDTHVTTVISQCRIVMIKIFDVKMKQGCVIGLKNCQGKVDRMKLNREQTVVCQVFSRRDSTGHVHCKNCPMVLDHKSASCIKTVTKEDAIKFHDWNGSPYPALGEYEGGHDG